MRRINRIGMLIAIVLSALLCAAPCVHAAQEEIAANLLLKLREKAVLYEAPDETAAVVGELPEGTPVISMEASSDGWIRVMYRELEGYTLLHSIEIEKNEALVAEFEQLSNESRMIFEVIENRKTQERQSLMWGIVIVMLVISVFVVGIGSTIAGGRRRNGRR
ncbi:MAG: hypothetical protein NC337_06950 [Roseburia sp.]|nr:hypothetical protein [Roseburia sp.]